MFVITAHGKKEVWANKLEDDFISATAAHFGLSDSEIIVEYIDPVDERAMRAERFKDPSALFKYDLSKKGKVGFQKVTEKDLVTVLTFKTKPVVSWGHDKNGKFLGNKLGG